MRPRADEAQPDRESLLNRTTITLGTSIAAIVAAAATISFTVAPDANAGERTKLVQAEQRVAALERQLATVKKRHLVEVAQLRQRARRVSRVDHALTLAAATYGVPASRLRRVATCESTLNPNARNGQYVGLFQFGQQLWNTTPYKRLSRTDPYAAAAAAAWAFKRGMSRHWPICGRR
jgi:hypothetical protein